MYAIVSDFDLKLRTTRVAQGLGTKGDRCGHPEIKRFLFISHAKQEDTGL